jgi:flavodoxin
MSKSVLIICASYHHENTKKIANAFSEAIRADVIEPIHFDESLLDDYDLIGFGSGIYNGEHHKMLINLVDKMEPVGGKKAFVFSTSTLGRKFMHKCLNDLLIDKGFEIIDEFSCKGYMNYRFTRIILGGLNKGRPNAKDLLNAMEFAKTLEAKL